MAVSDDELAGFAENLQNNINEIKQNTAFLKEVINKKLIKIICFISFLTLFLGFFSGFILNNSFRITVKQSILAQAGCEKYGGRWGAWDNRINYCIFAKE